MADLSTSGFLAGLSNELAAAVTQAAASVVRVNARRRFPASGIYWSADRLVVTADHVVEREEDITVGLPDGSEVPAKLVGRDPTSDLALLRLDSGSATPATAAAADSVQVGNIVLAVGRPNSGAPQATMGIVSVVGDSWRSRRGGLVEGFIRADVSMYPGFSGGPLVNAAGEVIGLNTSGLGGQMGITIPAAAVSRIVDALKTGGRLKRAFLGFSSQPVAIPKALADNLKLTQETGLMIMGVEEGSPAASGGLIVGDIVVALAGSPIRDIEDLQLLLTGDRIGQATPVQVIRGGQSQAVTVTPGERA